MNKKKYSIIKKKQLKKKGQKVYPMKFRKKLIPFFSSKYWKGYKRGFEDGFVLSQSIYKYFTNNIPDEVRKQIGEWGEWYDEKEYDEKENPR